MFETILLILQAVEQGSVFVNKLIDDAAQADELTPDQATELKAKMTAAFQSRAFKTDDQLKQEGLPDEPLPNPSAE